MRVTVATLSPPDRRGTAYGIYDAVFGGAWWIGSVAVGALADRSPVAAGAFGAGALAAGAAVMLAADRIARPRG